MSSYYETKFDVIYRKLQDKKLNLKKEFDGAYSKDDFQASLGVMTEIQNVMSKLTALESVEKPFKQVASIVGQIEETKLEIEIHLEELGKLVKGLDEISVVLRDDLVDEMGELKSMFQEEDGKAFEFQFDKFTPDELMVLMRYDKKLFPSRHEQYEKYWNGSEKVDQAQALETLERDLTEPFVVTEVQADKMDLILQADQLDESPGASEDDEIIDHGLEDLNDFGRQHHIHETKQEDRRRLIEDEGYGADIASSMATGAVMVPPDNQQSLMEDEVSAEDVITAEDISKYEGQVHSAGVHDHTDLVTMTQAEGETLIQTDNLSVADSSGLSEMKPLSSSEAEHAGEGELRFDEIHELDQHIKSHTLSAQSLDPDDLPSATTDDSEGSLDDEDYLMVEEVEDTDTSENSLLSVEVDRGKDSDENSPIDESIDIDRLHDENSLDELNTFVGIEEHEVEDPAKENHAVEHDDVYPVEIEAEDLVEEGYAIEGAEEYPVEAGAEEYAAEELTEESYAIEGAEIGRAHV